jgi:nitrogenase molybdenum-iron protein beta chain
LGGALAAAAALPRTVPIIHAGPGCAANFAWTQNGASGLQVGGPCAALAFPGTNLQENEVVFGGAERLDEEIEQTLKIMDGDLYFVLTGCVPEVIGDDVDSVVRKYAHRGVAITSASTAGFKGNSYFGYEEVLKTLFAKVLKTKPGRREKTVNVWGLPPMMDVFWKGNLAGVKDLLGLLGYRANVFFGPGASLEEIENAAGAELNIVLSDVYGLEAARLFKKIHGVDFISLPPPFGAAASDRFLKLAGRRLGLPARKISEIIKREGRRHYEFLEPLIDVYNDMEGQRYAIVIGDVNYGCAVADFLTDDLGWLADLVFVTDDLSDDERASLDKARSARARPRPEIIYESRAGAIAEKIDGRWRPSSTKYHNSRRPAFVAGSSLDRALAVSLGAPHLSLSFPVSNRAVLNRGYTGYDGGLRLMEDVISSAILMR